MIALKDLADLSLRSTLSKSELLGSNLLFLLEKSQACLGQLPKKIAIWHLKNRLSSAMFGFLI